MDISVIFSTCRRVSILKRTLDSFLRLKTEGLEWELVIVDNGCCVSTAELVESYADHLPITLLSEPSPGKNHALRTALPAATGELIVFCDDDVLVDPKWLREMHSAASRMPEYDLFGGRILPDYPDIAVDSRLRLEHSYTKYAFVIADWGLPEGPIEHENVWGPNMAVRRRVFDAGVNFNPKIGPTAGKQYPMGSETAFLLDAKKAGFSAAWVPKALVYHQIRPEQLRARWIFERAVRHGRGQAILKMNILDQSKKWFGVPRFLYREIATSFFKAVVFLLINDQYKYYDERIKGCMSKGILMQYKHNLKENKLG